MRAKNFIVLAVAAAHLFATAGCYNTARIQPSELTRLNSDLPGDKLHRPLTAEDGAPVVYDFDRPLKLVEKSGDSFSRLYKTIDASPQTFSGVTREEEQIQVPAAAIDHAELSVPAPPRRALEIAAGSAIAAGALVLIGVLVTSAISKVRFNF